MSVPFHEQRRQIFITEQYFKSYDQLLHEGVHLWSTHLPAEGDSETHKKSLAAADVADDTYELLSLHYTAGESLDELRNELEGVVAAYEQYQKSLDILGDELNSVALGFELLYDYQRCMQLIGLCFLLHRKDLLPRVAAIEDPYYYGRDVLYEELLDCGIPGRYDTEEIFHKTPYEHLVHAMYRDTDEESLADIKAYCLAWYPAMKTCPWHDGHLQMTDTDGHYFGYWAFEAGAVAFLLDIDDSNIDHMVYPKDLVAYARKLRDEGVTSPTPTTGHLRAEPNDLVPKTGLFLTMWLIHHFGLDYKRAVAYTLILCGLFWNGAGAVVLGLLGNIAWDWMPALLAGSLLGGYFGTHFALKKSNRWIKRAFELVTILIGAKLLLG